MTNPFMEEAPALPDAPGIAEAGNLLKKAMDQYPDQAAQILTAMGTVKNARTENYDAYVAMCEQLDVEPVDEERWAEHDKSVLKPLVVASLKKNLPFAKVSDSDIEALLDAAGEKSKQKSVKAAGKILLGALGADPEKSQAWGKLASAAANLI